MAEGPPGLVGAYELLEPLGKGGMGEVYRARDTRLGRLVAIKFLSSDLQDSPFAAARLDREARLASSLNHPGIVTVFDIGRVEGRPYVVMELIVGRSLAKRLADGPMELPEAVDVAAQVADALAAAHAGGVVHRDLKPQNIMLTNDGRAKVVDFGLSKLTVVPAGADEATKAGHTMTAPHAVLGTAGYMAPEQVAGVAVDARSDQFALGAVLYEMLTGRRAFRRETSVQTLAAILEDEPPHVSTLRHDTPPALAAIVGRCLAKRPDDRYASTGVLARELREARETLAMESRSKPSGRHAALWPAHRGFWGPLALVLLAVASGVLIWWRRDVPPDAADPRQAEMRQIAVLPFVNVSRDAEDQAFAEGLVETLTSSLTQLERFQPSLRVVPTSEIRAGRVTGAREALEAFGATLVVTGSVQRSESTLRLTLNLVDAARQVQRASRTVDVAAGTTTEVQDLVVGTVSALLALELEPTQRQAMTAGGTRTPGAYEAFVLARGYLQRFDRGAESVERAIDALNRAIAADPRYALAHASLCEGYWRRHELDRQAHWIEQAVAHCEQALAIDSRLAPVHTTLALVARGRGRYEEAVAVAQRAIELDPTSSEAYRELARAFEALDRMADAEATYQKAVAARPDDWLAYNNLGSFFYARGRLPEALAAFGRVTELTPDNTRGHNNLGATLHRMGRIEDATRVWERSIAIRPTFAATSNLGTAYFRDGRYSDAARAFERACELTPNDYRVWRNLGAALYWAPGERDKAAAAFSRAVELGEEARKVNPRQPALLAQLADAYSMLGDRQAAVAAAVAVERLGTSDPDAAFNVANAYEQLGERDRALRWLEQALATGYSREAVERSPSLAELRKDPRFDRPTR